MPPWVKILEIIVPQVINFVADRKNTRNVKDVHSEEILNDLYRRLDLAQKNDLELSKTIVILENRIKKVFAALVVCVFIIAILLISILVKIF